MKIKQIYKTLQEKLEGVNKKPWIEEQTIQYTKQKGHKDKQRSTKYYSEN